MCTQTEQITCCDDLVLSAHALLKQRLCFKLPQVSDRAMAHAPKRESFQIWLKFLETNPASEWLPARPIRPGYLLQFMSAFSQTAASDKSCVHYRLWTSVEICLVAVAQMCHCAWCVLWLVIFGRRIAAENTCHKRCSWCVMYSSRSIQFFHQINVSSALLIFSDALLDQILVGRPHA